MKIILVEGITDVNFVRYIYDSIDVNNSFNDFEAKTNGTKRVVTFENIKHRELKIINLKGQDNLHYVLENIIKPLEKEIEKLGILNDADSNFDNSLASIIQEIEKSKIDKDIVDIFLTPNNRDIGNLETLLLSSLNKENIPQLKCFQEYKECLQQVVENIEQRAIYKHEVESYIKFSQKPRNRNHIQFSFIDENGDTGLWDLTRDEFKPIISFVTKIFS